MPESLTEIIKNIGGFLLSAWWIWLPILAVALFFGSWLRYARLKYWREIPWILLEIKPSRTIHFSPKAAENIFSGLWGATFGTVSTKVDKYLKGVIQDYFSLEIIGDGGEVRFFVRTPEKFKNLIEAQVYAQYSDAEINQVEDYTEALPPDIPNKDWDLWGTQLCLLKPDAYPIRTYRQFIDIVVQKEGSFIDPLSSLMEVLGKLQAGEQIWIQILIRPVDDDWRKKGEAILGKLTGKGAANDKKKKGFWSGEIVGWADAAKSVARETISGKVEETKVSESKQDRPMPSIMQYLSPGEQEVVKAIEENLSKKGFETKINLAYLGRTDIFSRVNAGALMGVFSQFSSLSLNGFRGDKKINTKAYYLFAKSRKAYKQRRFWRFLRTRSFWKKGFVLNLEELATIFHFPATEVEAPATPRIEAKRGGAPPGLPV